jgi:hypothetical protein
VPLTINYKVSLNLIESLIYITQLNSVLIDLLLNKGNVLIFYCDYKEISLLAKV